MRIYPTLPYRFAHAAAHVFSISGMGFFKAHSTHVYVGPFEDPLALATEALKIPYIATTQVMSQDHLNNTFEVLPDIDRFGRAIYDLVQFYHWEKVSVFFDDARGRWIIINPSKHNGG